MTVGTGANPDVVDRRWVLGEVLAAMDRGDTFYTQGKNSGRIAEVQKYMCMWCRHTFIRSAPDAVADNNLDYLPRCA